MQDELASIERTLKESLINDIHDVDSLLQLGEIYYTSGRQQLSKICFSKILDISNDIYVKEKSRTLLFKSEHDIQTNQNKVQPVPDFLDLLIKELLEHSMNDYYYNIDMELFELMAVPVSIDRVVVNTENEKKEILKHIQGIIELFYHLEDQASRNLLMTVLAFRLLGNKKVKLPLNTNDYWSQRQSLQNLIHANETIKTKYHGWNLSLFDLRTVGYDLQLFCISIGLSATFMDRQYEYDKIAPAIKARKADIVIDAGGCFGDTALYFAHEVGENGHVYTIEFIPSNLEIMTKNLGLNENLKQRITIVERPLWNVSNEKLYYMDQGAASSVSFTKTDDFNEETLTISIDDLVKERNIPKIDFIKMDIESAEMNALKGATQTIQTFRPKLAIAIYHQVNDFANVVNFIAELDLEYKFYLGHYTIYAQETILFAVPE
ncbi:MULTISPECIES: FkbM family methyltransferase [unclassified Peribacillus]|uniref:FkbM family methyltransferase n=1 Tax=unclassified Peribacillus TaxID=2675266 RepID=UPI001913A8F2|nr:MULTISPECIES: FkbM family methyltransferase [unclassified Peribacillus]MBK5446723.1 FkbM family methyltransferase [Peribacillus sp. TH24]WMX58934.1 FkbM family methyltransferase [Peribacillus sp. R9-11]